jgi:hypothetical protein
MRIKIDEISKFLIVCIILLQLSFPNGFYLFFPSLITIILLYYLQRPFSSSIFSLLVIWHFFQIYAGTLLCNYLDKGIDFNTPFRSKAIVVSSIGLIALVAPIIYVQNKLPAQNRQSLKESIRQFSTQKVMYAYLISFFVSSFLGSIAFLFGGLTQIIFWLADLKWVFFLLFGYISLLRNEKKLMFFLFVSLEFISGFYSFFSEFKTVIFFVFILILSLVDHIDIKLLLRTALIGSLLLVFGLIWTSIKVEYRSFLNGGSKTQSINTNSNDALNKLYDLSNKTDENSLEGSTAQFLDRLQYTYFFAKTMERVPDVIPFQNGDNWLANLEFTTTPRYLNPDKPNLDQTEKTKLYTGIHMAGKNSGTSFSLGYFAECYIDFGIYGMMVLLLVIGTFYALYYKYLIKNSSKSIVFNYCVAGTFFMEFKEYALDGTFLLGRLIVGMLTFYLLVKFVFPTLIQALTIKEKKND